MFVFNLVTELLDMFFQGYNKEKKSTKKAQPPNIKTVVYNPSRPDYEYIVNEFTKSVGRIEKIEDDERPPGSGMNDWAEPEEESDIL